MTPERSDVCAQEARKHIFVVNGAASFLNLMRDVFQDERFNVTTTNYVPRSFEQIAALRPDALILDVALGKLTGWELLERLHADAETNGIPVLVVSTDPHLLNTALEQAERYGGHLYLALPFDLAELLAIMDEMIGQA